MAGIPKFIHKLQVKDQEMVKVFDRLHREIKVESAEDLEEDILLTFSTREPIAVKDWITILTFAGRVEDGIAVPNNGQTIQGMVAEEKGEKRQVQLLCVDVDGTLGAPKSGDDFRRS